MKRTVFYVVQTGVAIRNILRTAAFRDVAKDPQTHVVILCGLAQQETFRKEFAAKNVSFATLHSNQDMSRAARFFLQLKGLIQATRHPSKSYDIRIAQFAREHPFFRLSYAVTRPLLAQKWMQQTVDWLDTRLFTDARYNELFERFKPDLVFFAGSLDYDAFPLMRMVALRKIPSITFVTSWDNLTKGAMVHKSETLIVWNSIMQEEAVRYHGYPRSAVHVVGALPFDHYHKQKLLTRKAFCKQLGLDPRKKIILFASVTKHLIADETYVLRDLLACTHNAPPSQILARIYARRDIRDFAEFKGVPGIVLDQPAINTKLSDRWNPDANAMRHLANCLHHADLLVANSTTLVLEAPIFDTPVIGYAYDEDPATPYEKSCRRFYDYTHFNRLVRMNGLRLARSPRELRELVQLFLNKPGTDRDGRQTVLKTHIGTVDGQCGARIARIITSKLDG